jgi:hypothetical protein
MKKSRKKILFEINHFSIKNFNLSTTTNDLMTNQAIFVAQSLQSRFIKYLYELIINQQENYKANMKK